MAFKKDPCSLCDYCSEPLRSDGFCSKCGKKDENAIEPTENRKSEEESYNWDDGFKDPAWRP